MIQLEPYSKVFEEEYWDAVTEKIDISIRKKIVVNCKQFLPNGFFTGNANECFKELILAPFEKLKKAEEYITENTMSNMKIQCYRKSNNVNPPLRKAYKTIHDSYKKLASSTLDGVSMRVRIVKNTGLTVCPYCNRDYINCRADNVSGAQLDHFFNKAKFPLFAICLYNLVPVCSNCNRIKSAKQLVFASPFDDTINWDEDITFSYNGNTIKDMNVIINAKGNLGHNIEGMRIDEAYQIHGTEVLDLIEKEQMYNSTQKQEFIEVLAEAGFELTDIEIKKIIFGPEITEECMRTKPLGKMMRDLHKELKIYNYYEQ